MWHERVASDARREGRQEGRQAILLHQLRKKFGALPPDFVGRIQAIDDIPTLDALSEQVLTASSLDEMVLPETD